MIDFLLGLFVRPSLPLARFGQLLRYMQIIALSIYIMKVYIERNNMQVELGSFKV